ncbi:MAG: DUF3592 domain-containing protein [Desulfobacterales bacterium]|nr:DUF3592 domain-containing protein [Desulfobacterales bacterium]MDX2509616.1 DUF3592 domain-containing protein [Desulfobacterales bacterium]
MLYSAYVYFTHNSKTVKAILDSRYRNKKPTGILNESDGGIYITAQLLADAELWYGPKVFYSYSVAGQNYENVTLSFKQDSHTQSKEYAESIIAKYPPGGAVTVYYKPNSPSNSTIETGLGDGWVNRLCRFLFPAPL